MSNNLDGVSQKTVLANSCKMSPPKYVSDPKVVDTVRTRRNKTQGRNELCQCGSGSKYKKCCGKPSPDPMLTWPARFMKNVVKKPTGTCLTDVGEEVDNSEGPQTKLREV